MPVPVPVFDIVRTYVFSVKVAVTDLAAFIITIHEPVPVHPEPLHPVKVEPVAGVAVRVTCILLPK